MFVRLATLLHLLGSSLHLACAQNRSEATPNATYLALLLPESPVAAGTNFSLGLQVNKTSVEQLFYAAHIWVTRADGTDITNGGAFGEFDFGNSTVSPPWVGRDFANLSLSDTLCTERERENDTGFVSETYFNQPGTTSLSAGSYVVHVAQKVWSGLGGTIQQNTSEVYCILPPLTSYTTSATYPLELVDAIGTRNGTEDPTLTTAVPLPTATDGTTPAPAQTVPASTNAPASSG